MYCTRLLTVTVCVRVCVRKVKVNTEQAMKTQRGYSSSFFLTSALGGGGWSMLYPWESDPIPVVQEGFGASLDGCGKSRPHQDSIPGPSKP